MKLAYAAANVGVIIGDGYRHIVCPRLFHHLAAGALSSPAIRSLYLRRGVLPGSALALVGRFFARSPLVSVGSRHHAAGNLDATTRAEEQNILVGDHARSDNDLIHCMVLDQYSLGTRRATARPRGAPDNEIPARLLYDLSVS